MEPLKKKRRKDRKKGKLSLTIFFFSFEFSSFLHSLNPKLATIPTETSAMAGG